MSKVVWSVVCVVALGAAGCSGQGGGLGDVLSAVPNLVGAATPPPTDEELGERAKALDRANVLDDVRAAIEKKDTKFLTLKGAPAVPAVNPDLAAKWGTKVMPDTTDAPGGPGSERYQWSAKRYAERYNRALAARLPTG
jgi:hypothetical protein